MSKVYTVDEIKSKIKTSDKWLYRAILAIFDRQTADEKVSHFTKHNNGVGFNGRDASFFSSLAKQIRSWEAQKGKKFPSPLSPKQKEAARRGMVKYAGQLARIAAEKDQYEEQERDAIRTEQGMEAELESRYEQESEAEFARAERQQEEEDFESDPSFHNYISWN